jgi:hypothetical protein
LVLGKGAVDQLPEIALGELAFCLFFEERRLHEGLGCLINLFCGLFGRRSVLVVLDKVFPEVVGDSLSVLVFLPYLLKLILICPTILGFRRVFRVFCLVVLRDGLGKLDEQALVFLLEGGRWLRGHWHSLVLFEEGVLVIGGLDARGGLRAADIVVMERLSVLRRRLFLLKLELLVDGTGIDDIFGDLQSFILVLLDIVELLSQQCAHFLLILHVL